MNEKARGSTTSPQPPPTYYVRSSLEGTPMAVFRFFRGKSLAEIWRPEGWQPHEDFVRRYWTTGFEGDTDEVSEDDAAKAIAAIAKRLSDGRSGGLSVP